MNPGFEIVTVKFLPPQYRPVLLFNVTEVGVCPAKTSVPPSSVMTILASLGVLEIGTVWVGVPMMVAQPESAIAVQMMTIDLVVIVLSIPSPHFWKLFNGGVALSRSGAS